MTRSAAAERSSARLDLSLALLHSAGPQRALQALEKTPGGERSGDYFLVKAWILDAAGDTEQAGVVLQQGLLHAATRPEVARQAAVLLVRLERNGQALDLLDRALDATEVSPVLLLARAAVLGLLGRTADGASALQQIQSRWPEWDQPYLVQGLLLEQQDRLKEAAGKIQTAIALGSTGPVARCTLARLDPSMDGGAQCGCPTGLYEWLAGECGGRGGSGF